MKFRNEGINLAISVVVELPPFNIDFFATARTAAPPC
jgi:hypothetical protein